MNYANIYTALIKRATGRTILGYTEKHHIVPRCMGGTDVAHNLARLTPEEHYVAHQLLVKIFPDEPGLVFAAIGMCVSKQVPGRIKNKLYGWIKRKNAINTSKRMRNNKHLVGFKHSDTTKSNISKALKGTKKPDTMRMALSTKNKGVGNPMFGVSRSQQQKLEQSIRMTGLKNANADLRIHVFIRNDDRFIGTTFDFRKKYGLDQSSVSHLMQGRYKTTAGWSYNGVEANQQTAAALMQATQLKLVNSK